MVTTSNGTDITKQCFSFSICQIKSNQITFTVTSPQHKCLGEWNSYERAPDNLHMDSTYLRLTEDNVQNTQRTIKTYLVIDTHYTLYVHIYIMYTSIYIIMWRCNRLYIYSRLVEQQIVVQRCNRLCICSVVDVHCMVSSDSRCVSAVFACSPVELC